MRPLELLRLVSVNMARNKFKVISTSLGIVVGAVTIVLVIAIGQGGEQEAAKGYSGLSADTVYVNVNYQSLGADMDKVEPLTPDLLDKMQEENPYLAGLYLRAGLYKELSLGGEKAYFSISGVTQGWEKISGFSYGAGEGFRQERSVVLGGGLAQKYFPSGDSVGKKIRMGNYRYTITGVLEKSADGLQGLNADDTLFFPYETLVEDELWDDDILSQAVGKARDLDSVPRAMAGLQSSLDYYLQNSATYLVEDAGSRIEAATESARTMKLLLVSVAAIVFLVGGIGIMNVLFVTVKERTGEIGVLMALGSTRGAILIQFLLEAVFIGVFSGTVGVGLSLLAMAFLRGTEIPLSPSFFGVTIAFLFSVLTSALFGFYPAWKASTLRPVDALSYE